MSYDAAGFTSSIDIGITKAVDDTRTAVKQTDDTTNIVTA